MDARTNIKSRLPSRHHVTEGQVKEWFDARWKGVPSTGACSINFNLFDIAEVFKKTPCVADLKPGGRYVAKDIFEVGSVPLLMKTLLDDGYLHGDYLTVTGRTICENLKSVKSNPHLNVVRSADKPIAATGGGSLQGNLAPEGAIVKVAGMSKLKFSGSVPRFDREEDAFEAVQNPTYREGEVIVHPGDVHEKQCYAHI